MEENTQKALNSAISQIEKDHGKGALMKLGSGSAYPDIESISTGSLTLDTALGIGGLPKGRVVEIYGPESSGKTTIALQVIAQAQKQGGTAAFIDAEHALDPKYAENLGVNIDELLLSQPDSGEQALENPDGGVRHVRDDAHGVFACPAFHALGFLLGLRRCDGFGYGAAAQYLVHERALMGKVRPDGGDALVAELHAKQARGPAHHPVDVEVFLGKFPDRDGGAVVNVDFLAAHHQVQHALQTRRHRPVFGNQRAEEGTLTRWCASPEDGDGHDHGVGRFARVGQHAYQPF